MSTPITIFGSTEHLSGDNLPPRIENLNDKVITTETILSVNPDDSINANPISAYGKTLLDTTSLADLRATILENTNEEAIRLLADGNNEINFYTGGTGASNLKLQIKDNSIDVKNSATLNTANIIVGTNNYIKQKIEDTGIRVLVESKAKQQYCLYSYEENTNGGLLIQARRIGNDDIMEINNYRNDDNSHQPISINRIITSSSYVVCGAGVNPTNITSADFVSNGQSIFCNGASVLLDVNSSNITPYKNIIPSGSLDIGSEIAPFNNLYNNISHITNEIRMNTFVPVGSDYRQKGIFFRNGFNGTSNGDNMCIRSIGRYDPTAVPPGNVGDRMMLSAFGGLSINYQTNNALNEGTTGRIVLFHDEITIHKNMVGNDDGTISLGTASLKYNDIYGNNLRAHTSLYSSSIRPYSGSTIHFHNADITTDNNRSISVDNLFSSATNRDLYLGNGPSDIKMRFINGAGGEIQPYSSIVPPNADGLLDLGSPSKYFGNVYTTSVNSSTVTSNDLEANVSIIARGNTAYISAEDDNTLNGKVQIISENSSTYTGYVSFLKNDTRQMFLGYDNALQFENGSNFTIRSNAQTYLNFVHDANFANRKININVDLIPTSNSYDLGSANNRFAQIHGTTINASFQVASNQITPYTAGSDVIIDANLRPSLDNNNRSCGTSGYRWTEVWAFNGTIQTSDRNSKKDITPIKNALNWIRKLKPVSYVWKDKGKRKHTGFIAQEVLESSPYGSDWGGYIDTNGDGLGLRYNEFVSVNTAAIKELDTKLSKLQKSSVIIHEDGETKSDVNYHTDTSELYERIEALEQQIEEMSDSIGENVVQNVIEIQSDDDRTELTEELERLARKNDKLEETLTNNDAVIQELVNKINVLENRLKQKQDEETEESEGGINMVEMLQNRNYEMEQRMNKLEKQNKKLTSNLNKILKQLKNDTN